MSVVSCDSGAENNLTLTPGALGLDVKRRADGTADCILLDDVVGDELVEGT